MDRFFIIYMAVTGVILAPWGIGLFLKGIMAAWDEIETIKRYIRGY